MLASTSTKCKFYGDGYCGFVFCEFIIYGWMLPSLVGDSVIDYLFERSESLIATCKKKKTDRPDVCTDNLLVLVWKNCLGSSVRSGNRKRPKHGIPLPVQIHTW